MRGVVIPLLVGVGLIVLGATPVHADDPTTVTFTDVGEHAFTVPDGITSLHLVATGAPGGGTSAHPGGLGGVATVDVAVTPGEVLYAEVGGPGASGAGGANGGGRGTYGGGGASDVRTKAVGKSGSLTSRLVVAGGGGGDASDGTGGSAGHAGADADDATGGKAATATKGGAGGTGQNTPGDGSLGKGGQPANWGGGGGGGLYGGGAGNSSIFMGQYSGGGGGSSGAAIGTAGFTKAIATTTQPSVTITYTVPAPPPPGTTPTPVPTTTATPTPTPTPTPVPAKPALTALVFPKKEHGSHVVFTAGIGQNRSSLRGKLRYKTKRVGSVTKAPLNAGPRAITITLNKAGRKLHKHHHRLKLRLSVTVTPPIGDVVTLVKAVTLVKN